MKNVEMEVKGDILTIVVDLSKNYGESSSGKSIIIASTEGNQSVPGDSGFKIGLNIYSSIKGSIYQTNIKKEITDDLNPIK